MVVNRRRYILGDRFYYRDSDNELSSYWFKETVEGWRFVSKYNGYGHPHGKATIESFEKALEQYEGNMLTFVPTDTSFLRKIQQVWI